MRRKPGTLIPIEVSILEAAIELRQRGVARYHGFLLAKELRDREGARRLTAHGTMYKALDRLERSGLLASQWENPMLAAEEGRPRRRLYLITAEGQRALAEARQTVTDGGLQLSPKGARA